MGSGYSQEDYERMALTFFNTALEHPCLLPDVGIDTSLQKYSGSDSNAVLQAYSNELITSIPGYIERLTSSLAPMTQIPNAVGLGALVISIIMEICLKSTTQTSDDSYDMVRRVFGEEKASAVRDTMLEYVRRHQTFINDDQRLREEIRRLEAQLSNHLTILKNSLQHDGQMSTRGFKIWVNGAAFHVQMLIHEARLVIKSGKRVSNYVNAINAAISLYSQDLDNLLEKYKPYKTSTVYYRTYRWCIFEACTPDKCYLKNKEVNCEALNEYHDPNDTCGSPEVTEAYMNLVFSKYEPILGLKSHFSAIQNDLTFLINQQGSFTLPSIA